MTYGIHHITAISSDPQYTYDFYTGILGLKLIKKTVNQDDTQTYHLFFGDKKGTPGMDLTFFPFRGVREGKHGPGMANQIMMAVPKGSLDFWRERLTSFEIEFIEDKNLIGDSYLEFSDWDGQLLQLVETDRINEKAEPETNKEINEKVAIHNFYGIEIESKKPDIIEPLFEAILGFKEIKSEDDLKVFENNNETYANLIFSKINPAGYSSNSNGTVHHIAFRVKTDQEQLKLRDKIQSLGLQPTEVIDRFYFKSVYFREPGGVLFEIATDEPGFDVDEDVNTLGESLALPPFIESEREQIEKNLEPLKPVKNLKVTARMRKQFYSLDLNKEQKKVLFLLHGTGGDEYDLLGLFRPDEIEQYRIISLRGNIKENGMNRFFKRFGMGMYDQESIEEETIKLKEYLEIFYKEFGIKPEDTTFVGFSNGANMILATMDKSPALIQNAALLHPAFVLEKEDLNKMDGNKVLVTYGKFDRMIPIEESEKVIELLKASGAEVEGFDNNSEHMLTEEERHVLKEFLEI